MVSLLLVAMLISMAMMGYTGASFLTRSSVVDCTLLGVRGGAKEGLGSGSSMIVEGEERQPASALEIITLGDDRGLLVRKKTSTTSEEDFFIATTEQDPAGNYTLQLVPSSSSSGKKASILNDAVKSLQGRKEHTVLECDGLFGVYHLPSGYYLAVITKSSKVGSDSAFPTFGMATDIREVGGLSLVHIPCRTHRNSSPAGTYASAKQVGKEVTVATEMLLNTVSRHSFYFVGSASGTSLGYDITRNMQAQAEKVVETGASTDKGKVKKRGWGGARKAARLAWDQCDERFFWNLHAVSSLAEAGLDSFIVPVTNAWTASCELLMDEPSGERGASPLRLGLISRRSRHRQGQRYIKRGSDEAGDVANFVETEQILFVPPAPGSGSASASAAASGVRPVYLSLVQVRGSIPILWTQPETWRLKPEIVPMRNLLLHAQALKTHLVDLFLNYFSGPLLENPPARAQGQGQGEEEEPSLFFVNLIDKSGMQGRLGKWLLAAFERVHRGGVDCVSRAPATGAGAGAGGQDMYNGDSSARAQLLAHFDDLPVRVERERGLRDRKHITVKDFACTVRGSDVEAVDGVSSSAPSSSKSKGALAALTSRFIWFDYHKKCSKGAVHNLGQLLAPLQPAVGVAGGAYAVLTADRRLLSPQRTLVRTNCVDCLDRTNVVQTSVARWVLLSQLDSLGLRRRGQRGQVKESSAKGSAGGEEALEGVEMSLPWAEMETQFRGLWGNNGDAMSMLYAGTPALKRDVTRTGKRTNQGVFDDGMNSAMRYYINNYKDEQTQRELDFTLGHHAPIKPGRVIFDRGDREVVRRTLQGHRGGVSSSISRATAPVSPSRVQQVQRKREEEVAADPSVKAQRKQETGGRPTPPEAASAASPGGAPKVLDEDPGRDSQKAATTKQKQKHELLGRLLDSLTHDMQVVQAAFTSNLTSEGGGGSTDGGIVNVDGKAALMGLESFLNSSLHELTAKVVTAPQPLTPPAEGVKPTAPVSKKEGIPEEKENKRKEHKHSTREKEQRKASKPQKAKSRRVAVKPAKAKKPLAKVILPNIVKRPIVPEPKQKNGALERALDVWRSIHPVIKVVVLLLLLLIPLLGLGLPIASASTPLK